MNKDTVAGKTALVTGASRGVGRAVAVALAAEGTHVLGTSREPEDKDWPEGVTPLRFDMSSPSAVARSWDAARLDERDVSILVNNAGAGVFGEFGDVEFDDWEAQIGLMLLGPMKLSHLAMRRWSRERPGLLANVTSLATEFPIPLMSGYNAAKAGLSGFTESLMQETDPQIARVIELRLGDFNTQFNGSVKRVGGSKRAQRVWEAMERHVAASPSPEVAARRLVVAMRRGERGLVRAGSFYQAVVASLFGKIVSHSAKRAANVSYYNLSGN